VVHCLPALLAGLSVAVLAAALKIIPCISRVPFGALSPIWPPSICSVDQWRVVRSVRPNPYPQLSVLLGVRHGCHSPAPSGQSVRKL
jgi:hypothetical protein